MMFEPAVQVIADGRKMLVLCNAFEFTQLKELICKAMPFAEESTDRVSEIQVSNLSSPPLNRPRPWPVILGGVVLAATTLFMLGAGFVKIVEMFM